MNKIKLMYDVAVTMKRAGNLAGVLTANVRKGHEEVFALRNEFQKADSGMGRSVVSAKFNHDGHHVTRESTTEFDLPGCCNSGMSRRFFHGGRGRDQRGGKCGILGRISLALGVLNGIEAEERENGMARLSLNLDALPAEMKECLLETLRHKAGHCRAHGFLADYHGVENLHGQINVEIDKERKIQKITLGMDGGLRDADSALHELTVSGEVALAW